MTEHFSSSTVSAEFWCRKCQKFTQHRIDNHRKGPCLECVKRLEALHAAPPKPPSAEQRSLWGEIF
jgi:hypothetical protein